MLGSFTKPGWIKPREQNNGPGMAHQSVRPVRPSEAWQRVRNGKKTCEIDMARGRDTEREGRAITSGDLQVNIDVLNFIENPRHFG